MQPYTDFMQPYTEFVQQLNEIGIIAWTLQRKSRRFRKGTEVV